MSDIPSFLDTATFRRLVLEGVDTFSTNSTSVAGFSIPAYDDVVLLYANASFPTKPTYITFKKNGANVYVLELTYDANGALTHVGQD